MEVIANFEKALDMAKRVYNNKMTEKVEDGKVLYSDVEAIKSLCSKVFGEDGQISSMEDLRSFNRLIVETANFELKAKYEQAIGIVADTKTVGRYDQIQYNKVPQNVQTTVALSATATGVDFVKIPKAQKRVPAIPKVRQFGVQYEISEMVSDPVNAFRDAVDHVVEGKLKFSYGEIMKLAKNGIQAGKIPANQTLEGTNNTFAKFRKLEDKLIRRGNNARPILLADMLMVNDLALKQASEGLVVGKDIIPEGLKESLLRDVSFDMVSRTLCLPLDNPFLDDKNVATALDVTEGIMLAGGQGKPFKITEYGALRTAQDMPSIEDEKVLMKIDYAMDITLLLGHNMAYVKDSALTVVEL